MMRKSILGIVTAFVVVAVAAAVEVNDNGMRKLDKLPPAGVHPRVYFTADELPKIKRRLTESDFGKAMYPIVVNTVKGMKPGLKSFAALDFSEPSIEQIEEYLKPDEGRNIRWGMVSLDAVIRDDRQQKRLMIEVIANYSRLLLKSKEMHQRGALKQATGKNVKRVVATWTENRFTVSESWLFGAAGMAVSYDLLFNDMSEEERDVVRKAIATATRGRRSHGMDNPKGRAASNHYGYHGDLAVMLCAIEGEEGFDKRTYDKIIQVLVDYFEVGISPDGACHEDLYGPNLGLRAGSRGLLALARRGHDVFDTDRYRNFIRYVARELEPSQQGTFIGGASGGPGLPYPTSLIVAKYVYPHDPVADYVWRYFVGDDYRRNLRWQGWLDYALFGSDYDKRNKQNTLEGSGQRLSRFYPRRGKLIARSDWSERALYFQFDARPDAFQIGHDTVDRGHFNLSALGRPWTMRGSWHLFRRSDDHNLVHIDGKAQGWKAPMVKFLSHADDGLAVTGAADLKYAYDWQWSPPWPKKDQAFRAPWEKETNDPRDLGWPDDPDWLPDTLHHDHIGYIGSYLWRKPYNPVEKAFRSICMVRGRRPYVIVADDVKKDEKPHDYGWYMQLPLDLEKKSQNGNDVIIGEVGEKNQNGRAAVGSRGMLVRFLNRRPVKVEVARYRVGKERSGKPVMGNRLIGSINSVEPKFRVLLLPYLQGEELPKTAWSEAELTVTWRDQTDTVGFDSSADKPTGISVSRKPR